MNPEPSLLARLRNSVPNVEVSHLRPPFVTDGIHLGLTRGRTTDPREHPHALRSLFVARVARRFIVKCKRCGPLFRPNWLNLRSI